MRDYDSQLVTPSYFTTTDLRIFMISTTQILFLKALLILLPLSISGQSDSRLTELRNEATNLAFAKKYEEAESTLNKALEESIKTFGRNHQETGVTYLNLGEVQMVRKNFPAAKESYDLAISSLSSDKNENKLLIWRAYVKIVSGAAFFKNKDIGLEYLEKTRSFVKEVFKADSDVDLAFDQLEQNFYTSIKKYREVEKIFRRRFKRLAKIHGKWSKPLEELTDDHMCFSYNLFGYKGKDRVDRFRSFVESIHGKKPNDLGDIKRGNAISLPRPFRPEQRSNEEHIVPVRIEIDVNGNVSSARAVCGLREFRQSSEDAAYRARFRPTLKEGKPIKTTGMIVYRYN